MPVGRPRTMVRKATDSSLVIGRTLDVDGKRRLIVRAMASFVA